MILRLVMLFFSSFGLLFVVAVITIAILISGYDQHFTGILAKAFGSIRGALADIGINIPNLSVINIENSDLLKKAKNGASMMNFKNNGS